MLTNAYRITIACKLLHDFHFIWMKEKVYCQGIFFFFVKLSGTQLVSLSTYKSNFQTELVCHLIEYDERHTGYGQENNFQHLSGIVNLQAINKMSSLSYFGCCQSYLYQHLIL